MKNEYRSRAYTDRPAYANFEAPAKFLAIQSIIARRLIEHPKAICSYSGGSDSDILIDLIEHTREMFSLPPIDYVFFNTGLEMKATKDHVKATAEKYGVTIRECRPEVGIVQAARTYGIPFKSKIVSERLGDWQRKGVPLSVVDEYNNAKDKQAKFEELNQRFPKCKNALAFFCNCDFEGTPYEEAHLTQLCVASTKYMLEFLSECPPNFKISSQCCNYCKKRPAHKIQKNYDLVITGERYEEGGIRAVSRGASFLERGNTACFYEYGSQFKLRPLYYVSDTDKAWYKDYYGIRYSDAYEVYGLTRTGCCGCPINYKVIDDLEKIRPYEPNVVRAAWNIFGKSYEYRQKYNAYKEQRKAEDKERTKERKL